MDHDFKHNERGQSLVLIAVIMVVLIALAALAIDGGFAYSNRRKAQNAADAGALAGANALCSGAPVTAVQTQAADYATLNGAYPNPTVTVGTKTVNVRTFIPHETFLAGIFGSDVVNTTADASAGCYTPCSAAVLPVGWNCHIPDVNPNPNANACGIQYGTPGAQNNPLYVIMDSCKSGGNPNDPNKAPCDQPDFNCLPDGTLQCDLNGDGTNELMTGGNTSWLDLTGGGGGAADIKKWLAGVDVPSVVIHTWFTGQTGVSNVIYQDAADLLKDKVVFLPVFNDYCLGEPDTNCTSKYHFTLPEYPWKDTTVAPSGSKATYVHVIQFAPFQITCIVAPGVKWDCPHPARTAALLKNEAVLGKDNGQLKTIEGYFIKDYVGSGKCEGLDTGAYTVYLNK